MDNYLIKKQDIQNKTISNVTELNINERVEEIARMVSGQTITNEAIRRCLSGVNCPSQTVEKLKHFVSKNAFNIEGLGDKLIVMLFKEKIINDFSDIFKIYKYKELLEKREGLGKLSVSNLLNSIESKKRIPLDKFIYALGIKQIGENNAKLLALNYNSFENFCIEMEKANDKLADSFQKLVSIDQIGENIAEDIICIF